MVISILLSFQFSLLLFMLCSFYVIEFWCGFIASAMHSQPVTRTHLAH